MYFAHVVLCLNFWDAPSSPYSLSVTARLADHAVFTRGTCLTPYPSKKSAWSCMGGRFILFTVTELRPFNPSVTHTHTHIQPYTQIQHWEGVWADWVACWK